MLYTWNLYINYTSLTNKDKIYLSFREVREGGLYYKRVDCNSSLGNFYPTYELTVCFTCLFIIHPILLVIHGFLSPHKIHPNLKRKCNPSPALFSLGWLQQSTKAILKMKRLDMRSWDFAVGFSVHRNQCLTASHKSPTASRKLLETITWEIFLLMLSRRKSS